MMIILALGAFGYPHYFSHILLTDYLRTSYLLASFRIFQKPFYSMQP